jgi:hypothetical protein
MSNEDPMSSLRWQRREERRRRERERLRKHGASLRRVYLDAIKKRIRAKKATK